MRPLPHVNPTPLRRQLGGALVALLLLSGCPAKNEPTTSPTGGSTSASAASPTPNATAKSSRGAAASEAPAPQTAGATGTAAHAPEPVPSAPRRAYRVAALGDSITDNRSGGGGYLRALQAACPESRFDNFGKGGDMTNQMRRRFERDILPVAGAQGYDTLIVYGGVNDLYSDLTAGRKNDRIEEDLSLIYQKAKAANMRVVAITVSPWGGFSPWFNARRSQNTRLLNSWILGGPAAGRTDVAVDSYPLLSCGEPHKLCPDYQTRSQDGLHPGPEGHALLGQALLEQAFANCR